MPACGRRSAPVTQQTAVGHKAGVSRLQVQSYLQTQRRCCATLDPLGRLVTHMTAKIRALEHLGCTQHCSRSQSQAAAAKGQQMVRHAGS
jgi:hypothetical protein